MPLLRRGRRLPLLLHTGIHPAEPFGHFTVLGVHRIEEVSPIRRSVPQFGPQQQVLALVMVVQDPDG